MRPDFRLINDTISGLLSQDRAMQDMFTQTQQLEEQAASVCAARKMELAAVQLKEIPVEELKNSRAGIRIQLLQEAGFRSLYDLWQSDDEKLYALSGIGEKQVFAIRSITDSFLLQLSERERIRLPEIDSSKTDDGFEEDELICCLARYRLARQICKDAKVPFDKQHVLYNELIAKIRIRNRLRWLFSSAHTKEETLGAWNELQAYFAGPEYERMRRLYALYLDAVGISREDALADYRKNSSAYYALLENLSGPSAPARLVYGSLPQQLAEQISCEETHLDRFRGDLRRYQLFGVQYVLHQKKVLLGDEMGLGKTIQAIGVMVHLDHLSDKARFLVVCPASVMVNWCREIRKFSDISTWLLHGPGMEESFSAWERSGGAAVTNYESLRRITGRIDEHLDLDLLVVDEAHYIKNPDAQRTRFLKRLTDEAERILLMSGTPLENKVDEMCELIGFVRRDLADKVRSYAGLRKSDEFRELLSPVYLRRQADQVLEELPDLIENEEWCDMTASDTSAYAREVAAGNFMAMRRVSFLSDDASSSSKAQRLAELCAEAREDGKRVVVYSYFRETLRKAAAVLREDTGNAVISDIFIDEITGSTPPRERQAIIDRFSESPGGSILLCQIQAGGTGLNIQAASVVIFCEPQIKPSLERQAIARVYRMGQPRNVLVYHLLCEKTVDESIRLLLEQKEKEFALYAEESAMAEAEAGLADREWIQHVVEEQRSRYLPALYDGAVTR